MAEQERTKWQRLSVPGADGQELFVEVVLRGGREQVGLLDSVPFDKIATMVTQVAQAVGDALEKAKPNKAAAELGIEFGLEEGKLVALIARGSAKANLKISLEWSRS